MAIAIAAGVGSRANVAGHSHEITHASSAARSAH